LFSLVLSLSLALSVRIVRFETLYIRFGLDIAISSGAKEERLIISYIYIRVGREIWIGSTPGKKRVLWRRLEKERKLKRGSFKTKCPHY
jgi:hypothetical protein|tara:strand:+ start:563 stop:829 length:267 start_codon:yes stop_codon:yes gene_type:complete